MSNSLIPMGPSNADKSEMARLLKIMGDGEGTNVPAVRDDSVNAHYTGGHQGTRRPMSESRAPSAPAYMPSFGTSREEVDAMKNIMQKLSALDDTPQAPRTQAPQRQNLQETSQFALPAPSSASGPYQVLATIQESNGKDVNRYHVVDGARQDVVGDLTLKETASAIMKLLNKGLALDHARVQEVIDLEEEFNRNRLDTSRHRQRYQRSMELGESEAANVFKGRFNVAKANALAAQDQIKSILDSIR